MHCELHPPPLGRSKGLAQETPHPAVNPDRKYNQQRSPGIKPVAHPVFPIFICTVASAKHFLPLTTNISRGRGAGAADEVSPCPVPRKGPVCFVLLLFILFVQTLLKSSVEDGLVLFFDCWCGVFHLSLEYKNAPSTQVF